MGRQYLLSPYASHAWHNTHYYPPVSMLRGNRGQFEVTSHHFKGVRHHAVMHMWSIHALIAVVLCPHAALSGPACACPLSPSSPGLCRSIQGPGLDDVVDGGRGNCSRAGKQPGVYYLLLHVCVLGYHSVH